MKYGLRSVRRYHVLFGRLGFGVFWLDKALGTVRCDQQSSTRGVRQSQRA
jgi:hypothetical protein